MLDDPLGLESEARAGLPGSSATRSTTGTRASPVR